MLCVAISQLGQALAQPLGVHRRLEQVDGLLERAVLVGRDEERRSPSWTPISTATWSSLTSSISGNRRCRATAPSTKAP